MLSEEHRPHCAAENPSRKWQDAAKREPTSEKQLQFMGQVEHSLEIFEMSRELNPNSIEVIDHQLADVLRRKTPAERVQMIGAANRTARLLAAAGTRFVHPDWNAAQIHVEVMRRVCGGTD